MVRKKKSEETATSRRKTVYELVGERRPPFRRGVDPLDDILLDEERELSREVKRLRFEQIVMRKRRELERMKQQGGEMDMGSMASNADFMKMARMMGDLSDEEQKRVANAYAVLKMADKGQVGGSLGLLGPLLGYARQNPGASEEQMIKYLTLMNAQFSQGLEVAKAVNPNPAKAETNAIEFLKVMKDLVVEGVRNPLLQAIKESQPQPGIFEQILTRPELWSRAKEIGMFGGGSGAAKGTIDLEIEKLRGERQLEITKLNLDMKKSILEIEAKDRRTDTLLSVLGPVAAVLAGPTSQKMQTLGQQQAAAHNLTRPNLTPPKTPPQEKFVRILCSCGYEGLEPPTEPPRSQIECPSCGIVLKIKSPGTLTTEEST